jgi:serine phosphatase RsbU (regulator of sigma subunit)
MVSVVCNNALNRSVLEYNLSSPAAILNKTREIVVKEFEKSEAEVQDGMDIALCSLDGNILEYAGAYNPLDLRRNKELIELKADRWPVGMSRRMGEFTSHQMQVEKGDVIYLFTDGYIDQFGGKEGKKLKKEKFKKILMDFHSMELKAQKEQLKSQFATWKGNNEQVDDICIIGVRIS